MDAIPADLYNLWSSLNFVGEIKESMQVGPIYENATIKRNEELYQAEINKDDYLLFVDLLTLVSNKPIFGQVISEFKIITSRGINEDDHPMISKVFAEIDDVFAPDLSESTNFEDLYIELMYQETFTQLIDEIEHVLIDDSIYSMHHENGYELDNPAERLSTKSMSIDLYNNITYMLGNDSNTAPLMQAFNQVFRMEHTSKVHNELMEVLSLNLTIEDMFWTFVNKNNTSQLIYEITEQNKVSATTEQFYVAGGTNLLLNGIMKEWGILEFLIDQSLIEDYENDYFIEMCAAENENCECESGLIAFTPID
jgi:hypothetical protein